MANNSETKELSAIKSALKDILSGATNWEDMTFSGKLVSKMLYDNTESAMLTGREREREELVCRLLASGMSAEEISVVLNIRVENIRIIESNNKSIAIPDYAKKLKARRKYREKQK